MGTIGDTLEALFEAERAVRAHHEALSASERAPLLRELEGATRAALALKDEKEASVRLVRLATLLGDLEGDAVVDLLIDVLGSDVPEARVAAGEALEGLAFDRFKEVALGIERALTRLPEDNAALTELPFLLAEVAEPGCARLLGRFLDQPDAEVVASAIEAMAELGDPSAVPLLSKLERDARQVYVESEEGGQGERVAIADLAFEARELLEEMMDEAGGRPRPGRPPEPQGKSKKSKRG